MLTIIGRIDKDQVISIIHAMNKRQWIESDCILAIEGTSEWNSILIKILKHFIKTAYVISDLGHSSLDLIKALEPKEIIILDKDCLFDHRRPKDTITRCITKNQIVDNEHNRKNECMNIDSVVLH